jgi:hypothetical protein
MADQKATPVSRFSIVAIIAAYNEADVIEQVVSDLIAQGVHVFLLDDGSTDATVAAVERHLGRGVLGIEHLTGRHGGTREGFEWEQILFRKAELARELDADWFIHHDADEFRESPWPHVPLIEAIRYVDALGFNAVDSMRLDFWPTHDRYRAGDDVREAFTSYALPAPYDRLQIRCWKKTDDLVDLASSGGHEVRFPGRKVFPVRFVLRHYPIRGQAHGARKVFLERRSRFLERERARGWHVQYDEVQEGSSFVRQPSELTPYDPDAVRFALTLRHRGVEELEDNLDATRRELETARRELETLRRELETVRRDRETIRHDHDMICRELETVRRNLDARTQELARAADQLAQTRSEHAASSAENAALHRELARRTAELDQLHRSLSWRWTSPARAAYRILRGR